METGIHLMYSVHRVWGNDARRAYCSHNPGIERARRLDPWNCGGCLRWSAMCVGGNSGSN